MLKMNQHNSSTFFHPQQDYSGPSKRNVFIPPVLPRSYSFQNDNNNLSRPFESMNTGRIDNFPLQTFGKNAGPSYRLSNVNAEQRRTVSLNSFYDQQGPKSPGMIGVFS